jgi:peptide/nickel transport system substrate-binding protein
MGALVALGGAAPAATPANAEDAALRIVAHADLVNIDPIWTTAYITRNHGYMVYDTLLAMDENFDVRPQMVDSWEVSEDGLVYTFVLRDGLKWHDGEPVTAEDCVASIKRWGARDGMGQMLMDVIESLEAVDDKTIRLALSEPYGLVLESLGKLSSNVPFMMPKRLAETDPFEQVPEVIGSGPFIFVEEAWDPGSLVVYVRNEDYVPRDEPPSGAAGGKVAKADRVEWHYIPDPTTAMSALTAGEIDYWENPPQDLVPILADTPGIVTELLDPLGNMGMLRMNHLYPPFDHPAARQAMLWLIDQETYMRAAVGNPDYYDYCYSVFACGSPLETEVGAEPLRQQDVEKARQLFEEAGYDGGPVLVLQSTDIPVLSASALVTAQLLRDAGVNAELVAMDWATLTSRRASQEPPDQGGWNIFHTWSIGADVLDPTWIVLSAGGRERAWFGWPEDERMEELRAAFARETDPEKRAAIAEQVQERAYEIVTHATTGVWFNPVAYRDNISGVIRSPVQFFWNIAKG